jgi:hypothetical protein
MKFFLLIAAFATVLGLTQATGASSAGCCGGGPCCRPHNACCHIAH